jgi:2-methylisocitrate lyase-like PEP mutase family enzyme
VFEGLGAHLVRRAGFSAAYLTGAGVAVSGYGLPDIGLVTGSEMAERVALVVEASGLPVIADADTGCGNAVNVIRTVRAYERAGVAAIQLEDQAFPKRCGHLTGKELVSADEFVRKLHAALDAREADTVIADSRFRRRSGDRRAAAGRTADRPPIRHHPGEGRSPRRPRRRHLRRPRLQPHRTTLDGRHRLLPPTGRASIFRGPPLV